MSEELRGARAEAFRTLCAITEKLRAPDGCPWDREQTPETLIPGIIEETYEVIDAIAENDLPHIKEELGDLFFQVMMLSCIYSEENSFDITDVIKGISEKLVRRHPHVFDKSGTEILTSEEVLVNWARIKVEQEGRKPKESAMDEAPSLPPLERALKLQKTAAKAGFGQELSAGQFAGNPNDKKTEEEIGDVLFSIVNLCRLQKIDPSTALAKANRRFIKQFKEKEAELKRG